MIFHTFGDSSKPQMLLIHGVLCPWQIWDEVMAHYKETYFIIVPELDGHTQNFTTRFRSVEDEASEIEKYLSLRGIAELDTVCGLSMGGRIAALLWKNGKVKIRKLVLDGAPLVPAGGFVTKIVKGFYIDIVEKCKKRSQDDREQQEKFSSRPIHGGFSAAHRQDGGRHHHQCVFFRLRRRFSDQSLCRRHENPLPVWHEVQRNALQKVHKAAQKALPRCQAASMQRHDARGASVFPSG